MTAETIFDDAAEQIFDKLGRSAVFTPAAGDPVTLQVNVGRAVEFEPGGGYEAQARPGAVTVEYVQAAVGREADRGETFTVGAIVYTVDGVLENDGRFCKVSVV